MTSLADNPAVSSPATALTSAEQKALLAIGFYRRQPRRAGFHMFGPERVTNLVLTHLRKKKLVKGELPRIDLTVGGQIAADKLRNNLLETAKC